MWQSGEAMIDKLVAPKPIMCADLWLFGKGFKLIATFELLVQLAKIIGWSPDKIASYAIFHANYKHVKNYSLITMAHHDKNNYFAN